MGNIFKRYETKYIISIDSIDDFLCSIREFVTEDVYTGYDIYNLYFDTDDYLLINRSIQKPEYKEKIRLRSYVIPDDNTEVFLEIKKKFKGVVYKRRISITYKEALDFVNNGNLPSMHNQIVNELEYSLGQYHVQPKVFISYRRDAYVGIYDKDLRITFDKDLLYRMENPDLKSGSYGLPITDHSNCIMEIKAKGSYPLWLCRALDNAGFLPSSFSKVGTAYKERIKNNVTKYNFD